MVFFLAFALVIILGKYPTLFYMLLAGLLIILFAQTFWLLPELTARAEAVIAGNPKAKSIHHISYAVLEGIKLATILFLSVKATLLLIQT